MNMQIISAGKTYKNSKDSGILYELRSDAEKRGFLSEAEIEYEIKAAKNEKAQKDGCKNCI